MRTLASNTFARGLARPLAMGRSGGVPQGDILPSWATLGGVDRSVVEGVYQPLGAATLADSYKNLATPGVHDAVPGTSAPILVPGGWSLNGIDQYIDTTLIPTNTCTILIAFTGFVPINRGLCGALLDSTHRYRIYPHNGTQRLYQHVSGETRIEGGVLSGVIGMAGKQPYLNGVADGALAGTGTTLNMGSISLFIGALNNAGVPAAHAQATIKAFAFYSTILTAEQVAAISAGMAALAPNTQSVVIVRFDDGYASDHDTAYPIMSERGIVGTTYVYTDVIGSVDRMTVANLQALDAAGWSIANHTKAHTPLDALTLEQATAALVDNRDVLDGWGLSKASRHMSYPNGLTGGSAQEAVAAAGMLTGCNSVAESFVLPVNPHMIPSLYVMRANSPQTVCGWLTTAINANRHCVLMFHRVIASPTGDWQYDPGNFKAVMAFIQGSGAKTMDMASFYTQYVSTANGQT
jgi:peptidoglycan/xylan/chitin deacetylase (PgdA/CDA1 family)